MFKPALTLCIALTAWPAFSQVAVSPRNNATRPAARPVVLQDDKQKRRDEVRAAIKAQDNDAANAPAKPISSRDRAVLREQLRMQGAPVSPRP